MPLKVDAGFGMPEKLGNGLYRIAYANSILVAPFLVLWGNRILAANPQTPYDVSFFESLRLIIETPSFSWADLVGNQALQCSVAVYDRRRILLVRDRVGISSLFAYHNNDGVYFASELEELTSHLRVNRLLNIRSAISYLHHGRPAHGETLFHGIASVPAGHYVEYESGRKPKVASYYPLVGTAGKTFAEFNQKSRIDTLRSTLHEAVDRSLNVDGLALFLSGGVDSSYLAYRASRMGRSITCFTIRWPQEALDDEFDYAKLVADHHGLDLIAVEIEKGDVLRNFDEVTKAPNPCSAWACLSNAALLDAAVANGKGAILSGLGADEALSNYHRALNYYFRLRKAVGSAANIIKLAESGEDLLFPGVSEFFCLSRLRKILHPSVDTSPLKAEIIEFYKRGSEIDMRTNVFGLMVAHEMQFRVPDLLLSQFIPPAISRNLSMIFPYLDTAFVEVAASLYPRDRFDLVEDKWQSKIAMKQIAASKLPHAIISRPRGTFDFPFAFWIQDRDFSRLVTDIIGDSSVWQADLFRPGVRDYYLHVAASISECPDNTVLHHELWVILTLSRWCDEHLKS
jgi:asparagine synthase (glutamine-hydrolysing)